MYRKLSIKILIRLYYWNCEDGSVQEHNILLIPSNNNIQLPKMNIKPRLKY